MEAKSFGWVIVGFLLFLNFVSWLIVFYLGSPKPLEVVFFDVGQGDAIFIETPHSHQILIDGGGDTKILHKLSQEMPFWDKSLDLIVLTHPDKDHLAGLIEVLKRYQVDYVLWTGVIHQTLEFQEWEKALEEEKPEIKIAKANQRIRAGKIVLEAIYPLEELSGKEEKDNNDTSIVAKLSFGSTSFLFTGDIYQSAERKLIESRTDLNSDVLKMAHHGSKKSSSEEFLLAVSPGLAVISVGENSYGHPHQEVLEKIERLGIKLLRTDEKGDIRIISDAKSLIY